ncbi:hypothetical protein CKO25_13775 [Thiocapsa imhoffii]|uniref:Glycosyltransferase RgtA/B/C/D-like domain-containing protein n=1 Tax=Thiocapsa imhoffii TaxID=382777 RepID=A0A9X0WJF6_9GAMM|nr:glycosyltransferase family 39 protein [Thiocapsa imhoffii]MBK1645698.1 hypothetical protein [Thiocapsa imhoffii]
MNGIVERLSQVRMRRLAPVIVLLGLALITALRLNGLADPIVWHDEVFTLIRIFGHPAEALGTLFSGNLFTAEQVLAVQHPAASLGWGDSLRALAAHPEHAPLYYLLARAAATSLPLDPVTAVRGTSAVFGMLLPLAAFALMRLLFGRGPIPWVAATILAVSPLHLLYAQEARQYALWTLMILVSSAVLQRALARGRASDWWFYGACMTIGLYSHLLFGLMIPLHAVYLWLFSRSAEGGGRGGPAATWRPWLVSVASAMLLFTPWLLVLVSQFGAAANHTAWMERAVGASSNLGSWVGHLGRSILDLDPTPALTPDLVLIAFLVGLAVLVYVLRAPRPEMWLLVLIAVGYLGIVLGPDLLFGGSRSQHVRYGLPAVMAMQLMLAWVLGTGIQRGDRRRRWAWLALLLLVLLGGLSQARILAAESWWNKHFSAHNSAVARLIETTQHPLVIVSQSGVTTGEMISLAYHLDARTRIWAWDHAHATDFVQPGEFDVLLLLAPSQALRDALASDWAITPVAGTWQWWIAWPRPR